MAATEDPFELARFVRAQSGIYEQALSELKNGRKMSHWMWFIFPQIRGLGRSELAIRFAINSLVEARAYLTHPVLGPRLVECSEAVLEIANKTADEIFGSIDSLKLRSSMTLFEAASTENDPVYARVLGKYFNNERDPKTLQILKDTE